MTTFTRTWNAAYEASPPDSQNASQGATRIREIKTDVQERGEVDHSWAGDANDGAHKKVTLLEQASDPTTATNTGFMYTKDVGGVTELFYRDSGGLIIQMTTAGLFNLADLANLPVIIPLGVASAVNEVTVQNAAAGNAPAIYQSGAGSVGLTIQGINILADAIQTETTNGDVTLTRNGTGNWIIGGFPIYGKQILDTPILLVNTSSTGSVGNTPVDITTHTTGVAKRAILNVYGYLDAAFAGTTAEVLVGEGNETLASFVHRAIYLSNSANSATDSNQITVNLAAGEIFDYQIIAGGTTADARNVRIYLAGYET